MDATNNALSVQNLWKQLRLHALMHTTVLHVACVGVWDPVLRIRRGEGGRDLCWLAFDGDDDNDNVNSETSLSLLVYGRAEKKKGVTRNCFLHFRCPPSRSGFYCVRTIPRKGDLRSLEMKRMFNWTKICRNSKCRRPWKGGWDRKELSEPKSLLAPSERAEFRLENRRLQTVGTQGGLVPGTCIERPRSIIEMERKNRR